MGRYEYVAIASVHDLDPNDGSDVKNDIAG